MTVHSGLTVSPVLLSGCHGELKEYICLPSIVTL